MGTVATTATRELYERFATRHLKVQSRSGDEWNVCCPVHNERNASMRLNVEKGVAYCHGCGVRATVPQLAHKIGVPFAADMRESAMSILRSKLAGLNAVRADDEQPRFWPEHALDRYRRIPTDYWTRDRGFTQATIDTFDLGYDPLEAHAIIPIRDRYGSILGITRRDLTQGTRSRYKDPKGFVKADNLYASWLLPFSAEHYAVLMEGPLDAAKGWQAGHPCVAQYGSKLTSNQIRILRECGIVTVVVCYDNDRAGEEAFSYACGKRITLVNGRTKEYYVPENDLRRFFIVKRVSYPSGAGKDPGETTDADLSLMIDDAAYVR
jgi:DNA primase